MKIRTGFVSNSSSSSFCILGLKVTPEINELARKAADDLVDAPQEDYWCCRKCGFEPSNKSVKFCEKCGGPMDTATRIAWDGKSEIFDALDMAWYSESDYGEIAGFHAEGKSVREITNLQDKLFKLFGKNIEVILMSGEYYH